MEPRPLKTTSRNCMREKEGNEVKETIVKKTNGKKNGKEEKRSGRVVALPQRGIYDVIS